MMNKERKSFNFGDLDEFLPQTKQSLPTKDQIKAIDDQSGFPSREKEEGEAQINIKTSTSVLNLFRHLAKKERYRHGEFLEVLMNAYTQGKDQF